MTKGQPGPRKTLADGPWTPEKDLILFRRITRLVAIVPDEALPRVRAYVIALLQQERLPLMNSAPPVHPLANDPNRWVGAVEKSR